MLFVNGKRIYSVANTETCNEILGFSAKEKKDALETAQWNILKLKDIKKFHTPYRTVCSIGMIDKLYKQFENLVKAVKKAGIPRCTAKISNINDFHKEYDNAGGFDISPSIPDKLEDFLYPYIVIDQDKGRGLRTFKLIVNKKPLGEVQLNMEEYLKWQKEKNLD